jgi:hypothetical protein
MKRGVTLVRLVSREGMMHRMKRSMLVKSRSRLMAFFTTVLLVSLNSASAGGKDPLSPSLVRPGNLDHRIELPQGYLKVYSVSDEFNDGAYYAHSSYAIYSIDGRLFKMVENNISLTDDLIPWEVTLPIGSYTVVARSQRVGEVRVRFVIKAGQRTIVDLDLAEQETYIRHFEPSDRMASSGDS